jgi:polyisoprenoid-binding protein YceI
MPLPNDAVVSSSALTGELHLDGRPSTVQLDLQRLNSDQPNRDRYIRTELFAQERYATFSVDNARALPEGTSKGETLDGKVTGTLALKSGVYPLTFDFRARDDGDVVYVLAHTTFTWADIGLQTPSSSAIVSADEQVSVDVVVAGRPK